MAAPVAAACAGEPLSTDELLPKAEAEKAEEELEEDDDDELDETLLERLWGLTEMFPGRVWSAAGATFDFSLFMTQKMYKFSRAALWIVTTSYISWCFQLSLRRKGCKWSSSSCCSRGR